MPAVGSDLLLVQRGGVLYKAPASEVAALASGITVAPHYIPPWATTGAYVSHSLNALAPTTLLGASGRLDMVPFIPSRTITVDQISIEVTTGGATGSQARVGIYSANSDGTPNALLTGQGTLLDVATTTGARTSAVSPSLTLSAGVLYWLAVMHSNNAQLRAFAVGALLPLTTAQNAPTAIETLRRATVAFASGLPTTAPATTPTSSAASRIALRLA